MLPSLLYYAPKGSRNRIPHLRLSRYFNHNMLQALERARTGPGRACEEQCLKAIAPQNSTARDEATGLPAASDYAAAVTSAANAGQLVACCGLGCPGACRGGLCVGGRAATTGCMCS